MMKDKGKKRTANNYRRKKLNIKPKNSIMAESNKIATPNTSYNSLHIRHSTPKQLFIDLYFSINGNSSFR